MRKSNREINVFSMSALDLFASALGAFILIAIVLFPFFPNVGDSPERVAELLATISQQSQTINEQAAQIKEQAAQISELEKAPKYQLPVLDVVIVLDTTGSMKEEISALKKEIGDLAEVLAKLAPSVAIGIIGFNDRDMSPAQYTISQLQEISESTGTLQDLQRRLAPVYAGGGTGDNNLDGENLWGGFKLALRSRWRADAEIQIIIAVTDDVPHLGSEQSLLDGARRFSTQAGRSVTTVDTSDIGTRDDVKLFLQKLKDAGQGRYTETQSSLVAPVLLGVLTDF